MNNESIPSMGGKARAASLSDERKREIATNAAAARWRDRPTKATHKGNFKAEFGVDVDCYVLDDFQKTAVISQRGMAKALGLAGGGMEFPRFLATKAMSPIAGGEIMHKVTQPLKFQWVHPGGETPPVTVHGFDSALLIDVCRLIVQAEAEGRFTARQQDIVKQARIILTASAKSGIKGLVYALAGYNPTTDEVISAFKAYVQEEAKKYEKEFPSELYTAWYRLYEIPVPVQGKPWDFKHLTVNPTFATGG